MQYSRAPKATWWAVLLAGMSFWSAFRHFADFFQIAESTTLFKYPETEIVDEDDEENTQEEMNDNKTNLNLFNLQIMAIVVLKFDNVSLMA